MRTPGLSLGKFDGRFGKNYRQNMIPLCPESMLGYSLLILIFPGKVVHTRALISCCAVALAQHLALDCGFAQQAPKGRVARSAKEARKLFEAPFGVRRRRKNV